MALIIVQAVTDTRNADVNGTGGIGVLISVTDANGVPYTSLQLKNFTLQLMRDWFQGEPTTTSANSFSEEQKAFFGGEHIKGIYGLVFHQENNVWSPNPYTLIIQVSEGQNHGQIMVQFQVK